MDRTELSSGVQKATYCPPVTYIHQRIGRLMTFNKIKSELQRTYTSGESKRYVIVTPLSANHIPPNNAALGCCFVYSQNVYSFVIALSHLSLVSGLTAGAKIRYSDIFLIIVSTSETEDANKNKS